MDCMEVYVIKRKSRIMMNFVVCKVLDDWGSYNNDYMWNSSMCDCVCVIRHVKLTNI